MPIKSILIVDPSTSHQQHHTEQLTKRGFNVRTATNATETMERLAEEKPDLILMEVILEGQNGFQLTHAITHDPRYAGVIIFMCTSKNQETDKIWGIRQGASDYIVKPVKFSELMEKIKAYG